MARKADDFLYMRIPANLKLEWIEHAKAKQMTLAKFVIWSVNKQNEISSTAVVHTDTRSELLGET